MKFTLKALIVSKKTGLALDDEYDRLGFDRRPTKFPAKVLPVEVNKEFVREHKKLFGDEVEAIVMIDSEKTEKEDWEDWGSAGHMLSSETMTAERIVSLAN